MRLCIFLVVVGLIGSTEAAPSPTALREITNSISTAGVRKTLDRLYQDKDQWAALLAGIASGEAAWLNAAKRLRRASDGGAWEQIDLAAGEALEHHPAEVLSLVFDDFGLGQVCSGPDVDDQRFDSYDLSMAAIRRRQEMLRTLQDDNLTQKRDACIAELDKAKAAIARFYNHGK